MNGGRGRAPDGPEIRTFLVNSRLARVSDPVYALFRIVVGGMFLRHGLQKVLGLLGGPTLRIA